MLYLNRLINWILYTSIFAACCALAMCMATERLLLQDIPDLWSPLHALVAGSTLMVYNVHYLIRKSSPDISDRFAWSQHYKLWHYIVFFAGLALCIFAVFSLPVSVLAACTLLGVLSFAYSLPLLPLKNKRRLKDFGWIKILVLTLVWTIVTSVLPILYWNKELSDYPYEILLRFGFMFTLCIAFDIRDMQTDLESGIYTLPNIIGLKNSYRLMDANLLLFIALSIIQYFRYPSEIRLAAEITTAFSTKLVLLYTRKYPSDRAYLGLVDGMMLLYGLLVLWH